MANQTVGELNITMNLELAKLQGQIDSANKRIAGMARKAHGDVATMAKRMNAALSTIGLGLSIGGVVAFARSIVDLGGKITDVAAEAGFSTDAFQTLRMVALDSNVTMEQLAQTSTHLRRSMQEARDGAKTFVDAFAALGVDVRALQSLAPERQFELIARKIAAATDKHAAFNSALDILGTRGAPKLMAFLKELGEEGFDKLADGLKSVNLSKEQLAQLDAAGDKLGRIWEYTKLIGAKGILYTADIPEANRKVFGNPYGVDLSRPFGIQTGNGGSTVAPALNISSVPMTDPNGTPPVNTAEAQYNAQIAALERLEAVEAFRAKGLGYVSQATEQYADQINETWRALSKTKDIALSLDAAAPFAFDKAKLDEAARGWGALREEEKTMGDINAHLNLFFGDMDEQTRRNMDSFNKTTDAAKVFQAEMAQMWNNVSDRAGQAFADMVLEGKASFADLATMISRSMIEVTARMAIINPLLNGVFGAFSGWGPLPAFFGPGKTAGGSGGGRAGGGDMREGIGYQINEGMPEVFVPSVPGKMVPNARLSSLEGNRAGDSYNFTYNIPAGVTRAELMPALMATKRATIAELQDMRRRGKAA